MSCFAGKLKEYPSFSVDCFDKNNLDSDVYFLSHCHQGTSDTVRHTGFVVLCSSNVRVFIVICFVENICNFHKQFDVSHDFSNSG